MRFSTSRCRVENEEVVIHVLVDLHDACLIRASVTVVWRRKDCYYVLIVRPVEPVHHKLMSTGDQFQVVHVIKLF